MGKRIKKVEAWIVKRDEFYPDDWVAARYADQNSRLFTRKLLQDTIRRLQSIEDRNADVDVALAQARERLAEVEAAVADFNREEQHDDTTHTT